MILTKTDRKIEFYNVFYFIELTDINEVSSPFLSYVASKFCVGLWVRNLERVAMSCLKRIFLFFLLIIDCELLEHNKSYTMRYDSIDQGTLMRHVCATFSEVFWRDREASCLPPGSQADHLPSSGHQLQSGLVQQGEVLACLSSRMLAVMEYSEWELWDVTVLIYMFHKSSMS